MSRVNSAEPGSTSDTELRSTSSPAELRNEIEQIRGELTATVAALTAKLERAGQSAAVVAAVAVTVVAGWLLVRRLRR